MALVGGSLGNAAVGVSSRIISCHCPDNPSYIDGVLFPNNPTFWTETASEIVNRFDDHEMMTKVFVLFYF